MAFVDELLRRNEGFAQGFDDGDLAPRPAGNLAVVTCMDTRLALDGVLGLNPGEAHIIRNAGGVVSDDVLRSLAVSIHLAGTREIMVIHHTQCAMFKVPEDAFWEAVDAGAGEPVARFPLFSFADPQAHLRQQLERLRGFPALPPEVSVRGFVYDVKTGRLSESGGPG